MFNDFYQTYSWRVFNTMILRGNVLQHAWHASLPGQPSRYNWDALGDCMRGKGRLLAEQPENTWNILRQDTLRYSVEQSISCSNMNFGDRHVDAPQEDLFGFLQPERPRSLSSCPSVFP